MRPVRLHLHTSIAYASHSAPSASCDPHSGARRGSPHSHARHRDTMHAPTCLSARHHVLNQLRRGDTLAKATTPVRLHTHRCAEASPGRVQQGPCMPHPPGRGAVVLPCHTSPNSHTDLPRSPATPASHRPQQPHLRLRLRLPCSSGFLAPPASLPIRRLRRPCPSGLPADPTVPCLTAAPPPLPFGEQPASLRPRLATLARPSPTFASGVPCPSGLPAPPASLPLRLRLRLPCSSGFLAPPASLPIRRLRLPCPSGLPADPTCPVPGPSGLPAFPPLRLPAPPASLRSTDCCTPSLWFLPDPPGAADSWQPCGPHSFMRPTADDVASCPLSSEPTSLRKC